MRRRPLRSARRNASTCTSSIWRWAMSPARWKSRQWPCTSPPTAPTVRSPLARSRLKKCRHAGARSEEHTSELQSHVNLVCRLLLEKKNNEEVLKNVHGQLEVVECDLREMQAVVAAVTGREVGLHEGAVSAVTCSRVSQVNDMGANS